MNIFQLPILEDFLRHDRKCHENYFTRIPTDLWTMSHWNFGPCLYLHHSPLCSIFFFKLFAAGQILNRVGPGYFVKVSEVHQFIKYRPTCLGMHPRKLTANAPENGWLEDDPASFWGLVFVFSGAFAVSFGGCTIGIKTPISHGFWQNQRDFFGTLDAFCCFFRLFLFCDSRLQ